VSDRARWRRPTKADRVAAVLALTLAVTVGANAQASGPSGTSTGQNTTATQIQSSSTDTAETRPATTTFFGDTGLWYVPTAEVLPHRKWSVSGYRRGDQLDTGLSAIPTPPILRVPSGSPWAIALSFLDRSTSTRGSTGTSGPCSSSTTRPSAGLSTAIPV
jgi:hypothetical protein